VGVATDGDEAVEAAAGEPPPPPPPVAEEHDSRCNVTSSNSPRQNGHEISFLLGFFLLCARRD